jgi:hypothetical protein
MKISACKTLGQKSSYFSAQILRRKGYEECVWELRRFGLFFDSLSNPSQTAVHSTKNTITNISK